VENRQENTNSAEHPTPATTNDMGERDDQIVYMKRRKRVNHFISKIAKK